MQLFGKFLNVSVVRHGPHERSSSLFFPRGQFFLFAIEESGERTLKAVLTDTIKRQSTALASDQSLAVQNL